MTILVMANLSNARAGLSYDEHFYHITLQYMQEYPKEGAMAIGGISPPSKLVYKTFRIKRVKKLIQSMKYLIPRA